MTYANILVLAISPSGDYFYIYRHDTYTLNIVSKDFIDTNYSRMFVNLKKEEQNGKSYYVLTDISKEQQEHLLTGGQSYYKLLGNLYLSIKDLKCTLVELERKQLIALAKENKLLNQCLFDGIVRETIYYIK